MILYHGSNVKIEKIVSTGLYFQSTPYVYEYLEKELITGKLSE